MSIKVSQLTEDSAPTSDDFVLATDNASGASKKVTMGHLVTAGLPSQTSNSGKFLTTDGSSPSWGTPAGGGGGGANVPFVYNVKSDYGAVGNNSTNDTTSIQNAINAAHAAGGGVVFFPQGTYKVTSVLTIYAGVSLLGESSEVSIINQTSTTAHTVSLVGGGVVDSELFVESLGLTGPGSGSGDGLHISGLPLGYLRLTDVATSTFGGSGVYLGGAIVTVLSRVVSTGNLAHGIFLDGAASFTTSLAMTACYGNNNNKAGIHVKQATYVQFSGCAADSNGIGYYMLDVTGGNLAACGSESSQSHGVAGYTGISFKVEGTGGFGSNALNLTGCFSSDVHTTGFLITGFAVGASLISCIDEAQHAGATNSIQVDSNAAVSLVGCTWAGTRAYTGSVVTLNDDAGTATIPNLNATNIFDQNNKAALSIVPITNAVNGLMLTNAATGGSPLLGATGTDTNVSLYLEAKGTGSVRLAKDTGEVILDASHGTAPVNFWTIQSVNTGQAVPLGVTGSDTDVYMNLTTKGTGTVRANGVDVPTISGDIGGTQTNSQITNLHLAGDTAIGHKLTSVVDPGSAQDAATKNYVDTTTGSKATDSLVVHLAGTETLTGAKTFNAGKLLDKGSAIYDVRAYGAVCDGSTDDTTAIQAAITAAAAAGGGRVFVPASSVISNITLGSYVELLGASTGVQLIAKAGATGYMVALTTPASTKRTAVRNITLKPNQTGLGGIKLDNTGYGTADDPQHTLDNVLVTNAVGTAFFFDNNMRELRVRNCKAYFGGGEGFFVGGGCTDSHFTDCTAGTNASNGWDIVGNNNHFVGCKAFWSGYNGSTWGTGQSGFYINGAGYCTFGACAAQQNAVHGFDLQSALHVAMVGCESDTNSAGVSTGVGVNTNACTYCIISGTTGGNNGGLTPGAQKYGLQVNGTQTNTEFIGNSVTGSSGDFNYVGGGAYGPVVSHGTVDFSSVGFTQFGSFTEADGSNIALGTGTGTKIGTATNQKLAFFNSTPIGQPTGDIVTALTNLGLVSSPTLNTLTVTAAPSAGASSGTILSLTSAQTQAIGDVVQINGSGQANLAKADVIANASVVAIATAAVSGSASNTYLLEGVLRLSASPGWTVGGTIYLTTTGTTGNTLTQTAPSGANNVIQILGVALAADTILFKPSLVQVEHV